MSTTNFRAAVILLLLLGAALPVHAQQSGKKYRIGYVANTVPMADLSGPTPSDRGAIALIEGLRELGWINGKNIEILWRSAEGSYDRRPQLIEELVRLRVDAILVIGNFATAEALEKTRNIPILMITSFNPVGDGLVASLASPGGNVTGLTLDIDRGLDGKRLDLLKQAAPHITRVAFLVPAYANRTSSMDFVPETLAAGRKLGLSLFYVTFKDTGDLERAFTEAIERGANGLFLGDYSAFSPMATRIAIRALVERYRLPATHSLSFSSESGALLTYAADGRANFRRAAHYVDRILKGAKPGDLPIERPGKLSLVVNQRAAKAIGLTIPQALLAQADRVID